MSNGTNVKKINGSIEPLNLEKMHVMCEEACKNLAGVSSSQVEIQSGIQFYDGITTAAIQEILIKSASDLISLDNPNYQFVAARLLLFSLRKSLYGRIRELPTLFDHINKCVDNEIYDADVLNKYTKEEIDHFDTVIDHGRDFIFTYAGLRQVVDKYLVQDRSSGQVYETPQFMYLLIAMTIFADYPQETEQITLPDTTMPFPNTRSTSQHQSWEESEHPFGSLRVAFWLMLMTPWIVFLVLIWPLAAMSHKGLESVLTQGESVVSTVKSEVEKFSTQGLYLFSKNLKRLSDVALKTALEVDQRLSISRSGTKK